MKPKKIPLRKCVGCLQQHPKNDMVRIVHNKQGEITIDYTGKAHGRGAYICLNLSCFKNAQKKRALSRAFSCKVNDDVFEKLYEVFKKDE